MWKVLILGLAAGTAVADGATDWVCTVHEALGAGAVGALEAAVVAERPSFRIALDSGTVSDSTLPGFGAGRLLRGATGADETWAGSWLVEEQRGVRADTLRMAGNPADGELAFIALHAEQLYAGRCVTPPTGHAPAEPYEPPPPPMTPLATYYNCVAIYLSELGAGGLTGYRIDARELPRFQLDTRNAVYTGRIVEGFGRGDGMLHQPVPGQPWSAYWLVTDAGETRLDAIYLAPRPDLNRPTVGFVALSGEWIFTGVCAPPEQSGGFPPAR